MSEIKDVVSLTSRYMAAVRAIETQRPDRLFADPLAAQLAGDEIIAEIAPKAKEYEDRGAPIVAVRTHFFDNFLMSETSQLSQVVILGAGMDTRAFRLPWHPETHLYELDQPQVIQTKESLLGDAKPKCHRHLLSIDIREPWSHLLIDEGYQVEKPSVWILEGLLYYLNPTEVDKILMTITNLSASGSWLGADFVNEKMLDSPTGLAQYWRSGCDEPETFLANYGWQASVIHPGDEGADFGRFTYKFPPRDTSDVARSFFAKARKD